MLLFTSLFHAQNKDVQVPICDILNISNNPTQSNTLIRDWKIFNYPLIPSSNFLYSNKAFNHPFNWITSPLTNFTTSKEEMLFQFRSLQHWDTKKKYNVFYEYLGYAQLLGTMGLLGVHIYQWSNLKDMKVPQPKTKLFNKYDVK